MKELLDEARMAIIVAAMLLGPYLCYRASGALENEEIARASRVTGTLELSGPLHSSGSVAAFAPHGHR